ncbi:hypothetical protein CTAYLR_009036 [Chrysophaeum taylorii]|uniref:Amine oxidase n=1 Tax=Chrysophaeum taylorii TaxID=2483200 RepID=A0AAD7UDS5_9STRA|nr:hypothetical protein CTAYLR_009036 [Chrysophaeum taylorii]
MDVVVVGGGAAGLACVRELRGVSCVLLEARRELGGRVRSFEDAPAHDAGAAWVHGTSDSPLAKEAQARGVALAEVCASNPWCDPQAWRGVATVWRPGGERVRDAELRAAASEWANAVESLSEVTDANAAFGPALRVSPLAAMHGSLVELWMGASLDDLQLREFAQDDVAWGDHPGPHALPAGGMGRVLSALITEATKVAVLGARVDRIKTRDGAVDVDYVVDGRRSRVRARCVVVTLPLGVLQRNDVVFDPPLPAAKRGAIDRLGFGAYAKILLFWRDRWWPSHSSFLVCLDDDDAVAFVLVDHAWSLKNKDAEPLLEATVAGDKARVMDALPEAECVAQVLACLRRTFGVVFPDPVKTIVTRWTQDPHARGAYSYWRRGAEDTDVDTLAQPLDPLFFAGEATSVEYQGSLTGALETGLRVASEVLGSLRGGAAAASPKLPMKS